MKLSSMYCTISCISPAHTQEPATEGTVKAHANFNPETDARALRDAMKGFGEHNAIVQCHALHVFYICRSSSLSYEFLRLMTKKLKCV